MGMTPNHMNHQEKIKQLSAMLRNDPEDPLTWYLLGMENMHVDEYSEAIIAFKNCIHRHPDHTAAIRMLADAWRMTGDLEKARGAYEDAIHAADRTGDLQVKKEAEALLKKLGR